MATPGLSEIATTTLRNRSRKIADNISNSAALLYKLKERGGRAYDPVDGGESIQQELSFDTNDNAGWYSGYDTLPTGHNDTLSAAEFALKQCACPVIWSGLEELKNAGKEKAIDLVARRVDVAEISMQNIVSQSLYSDGTAHSGKEIVGVLGMCPVDGTTGTYGGINRATYTFWRPYNLDTNAAPSASTIQAKFTTAMVNLSHNSGSMQTKPDLIVCDNDVYEAYLASLQTLQRFTESKMAEIGFQATKFMGADVVCDEGIDGYVTNVTAYFLNTQYIHWRPHKERNFVPLGKRMAFNQDATAQVLAFAGALTCSGSRYQGQIVFS